MGRGPMVNMPALPGMPMGMYPHNFQNSANMGSFNFRSIPAPPPALPAVVMTEKLSGETGTLLASTFPFLRRRRYILNPPNHSPNLQD